MQSHPLRARPITVGAMAAALALVVLSLFTTTPASASSNLTFEYSVRFVSWHSVAVPGATEMCLANPGKSQAPGTKMVQLPCSYASSATEQQWALWKDLAYTDPDHPVFQIRNLSSGLCLAVPNASRDRGVQLIQWGCGNNGNEQRWVENNHDGAIVLTNLNSGLAMAVSGGRLENNWPIIQWTPNNGPEQDWVALRV